MRTVALYIYIDELIEDVLTPIAHRIELFADENINITSTIQNFQDLGAIFTDFTQPFTVPASTHNNKIFKHWYESALQNGFDHRISYYGFIEIDTIPFRYGKFKLTKANAKNGMIESYSINFVGNLVQLRDRFQEQEIADLQVDENSVYNQLNFTYNAANMEDILSNSIYPNVRFPLIGNSRRYECGTGGAYDITTTSGKIDTRELFPAIPLSKIFEYIQTAYGLTFSGVFFNSLEFQRLWLYCKNSETFTVKTESILVEADNEWTFSDWASYTLATSTLTFQFTNALGRIESWIDIAPTDPDISYSIDIYDNGVLYRTYDGLTGFSTHAYYSVYRWNEPLINGAYPIHNFTFKVRSDLPMTFTSSLELKYQNSAFAGWGYAPYSNGDAQSTSSNLNIRNYIPKIKVIDFITGIIKMFNLMIVPISETSFEFITMEAWYNRGQITDITKYIDKENIDINSPKLFRKISFMFEQSSNILNNAFRGLFNQYYADLLYESQSSAFTENYDVKLPFENIMFERYPVVVGDPTTTFLTATCWDKDTNPYVPKPVLLYDNLMESLLVDGVATDIKYKFGATNFQLSSYKRFSNELNIGGTDLATLISSCWGVEISPWQPNLTPPNGLYGRYYANYIENLYNISTRLMNYKFIMPTSLLTKLKLNDRVIVQNKRFVINKMNINLSTKECNIELLNDFRNILNGNAVDRNTNLQSLIIDNTAQDIQLQVYLNRNDLWRGKIATGFLTSTYPVGTNYYEDGILNISVPANATAVDRTDNILIEYYKDGISTVIQIPVFQYA